MLRKAIQRGDTLIEVLLAVTVFSVIAVGTMGIMNQGVASAQRSLEITLVRQQIDAQAEALRAVHQAYTAVKPSDQADTEWVKIRGNNTGTISVSDTQCPTADDLNSKPVFAMNPTDATQLSGDKIRPIDHSNAPVYAQYQGGAVYGLWIEREKISPLPGSTTVPNAYDFKIRACWQSTGEDRVPTHIETVVRLYDVS